MFVTAWCTWSENISYIINDPFNRMQKSVVLLIDACVTDMKHVDSLKLALNLQYFSLKFQWCFVSIHMITVLRS